MWKEGDTAQVLDVKDEEARWEEEIKEKKRTKKRAGERKKLTKESRGTS